MSKYMFILVIMLSTVAYASSPEGGAEHHASIKDLLWPFVNFVILFGFLGWKIKKPISEAFTQKAIEIEGVFERASEKSKEAEIKLKMFKDKKQNIDNEKSKIVNEARREAKVYAEKAEQLTIEKIDRYRNDTVSRLQHEREVLVRGINDKLVNDVVAKAKTIVSENKTSKDKVSEKLLSFLN